MTPAEIAAQVAARKAETLARLNPVKLQARTKVRALQSGAQEMKTTHAENNAERELLAGHPYDLFITPAELAERMCKAAHVGAGDRVLEPEAGTGRIAQAVRNLGAWVTCCDLNQTLVRRLIDKGFEAIQGDFLQVVPAAKYNAVIMNPPFSNGQDIDHVLHAWNFIEEGYLVAIMSEGVFYRSDKKSTAFCAWLDTVGGTSEKLPDGTFYASGTNVNARMIVVSKQPNYPH
jgi:tRNA G37 N-methylase Trm5